MLIVVLEVGARVVVPEWGPAVGGERVKYCQYDALLGWSHRPGMRADMVRREFAVPVSINALALRDRDYPIARNDRRRMLVLGDSFGWGVGVTLEQRFDELLEGRLPDWEIINASVSGYGTDQQLLYLTERGHRFQPDVVLVLMYRNDFANNNAAVQYFRHKPYFEFDGDELAPRNLPVPGVSAMQRLADWVGSTYILGRAYLGAKALRARVRFWFSADDQPSLARRYPLTSALVKRLHDESVSRNARFVLVSVPMERDKREAMQRLADAVGFPYLPLDDAFGADPANLYYPIDGHWNPAGHAVAADAIERFLDRIRIIR